MDVTHLNSQKEVTIGDGFKSYIFHQIEVDRSTEKCIIKITLNSTFLSQFLIKPPPNLKISNAIISARYFCGLHHFLQLVR